MLRRHLSGTTALRVQPVAEHWTTANLLFIAAHGLKVVQLPRTSVNARYMACRCGFCNAAGRYIDVLHHCCLGVLDAAGVCCESGSLDDCGVCDGDHTSCRTAIQLDLLLPGPDASESLTLPTVDEELRHGTNPIQQHNAGVCNVVHRTI